MSELVPLPLRKATMTPPAPSLTLTGAPWIPARLLTRTPPVVHWARAGSGNAAIERAAAASRKHGHARRQPGGRVDDEMRRTASPFENDEPGAPRCVMSAEA